MVEKGGYPRMGHVDSFRGFLAADGLTGVINVPDLWSTLHH